MTMNTMHEMLSSAHVLIQKTGKSLELSPTTINKILQPEAIIELTIPFVLDNGEEQLVKGYRV